MTDTNRTARKNQDTYVYIDVSNIRSACLKTLGLMIDFVKLLDYLKQRYPQLKDARYYEGIATDDAKKKRMFKYLERKGYTVCALERKSYSSLEREQYDIECPKCGNKWAAELTKEHKVMKSNVDVFLASDMVARASTVSHPTRLILVSCDGDYAEAIRNAIRLNDNISVAVLATPTAKDMSRNTLSVRLKSLRGQLPRYKLHNIDDIRPFIEAERR